MRFSHFLAFTALLVPSVGFAQGIINTGGAVTGGVAISTEGVLRYRQTAAPVLTANRKADLLYVSLPRALDQWKAAKDVGKTPPADVLYLKGLVQIQDIFLYPDQHDIVLAGPAEPYKADNPTQPLGTITGRPVVQLEDLIVALRAVQDPATRTGAAAGSPGGRDFYGCSLENPANFQEAWKSTLDKFGQGPRTTLLAEMKKALGPQEVKLYGVPGETRIALTMLAADYHLKRISMGVEAVPNLGNALGNQVAAPRIWFEPSYEPLLVSADQTAYEFRGPRLQVLAGAQQFNPGGVNEAQKRFADNFTSKMTAIAAKFDAVADLQNVTDCFMLAALARQDHLTQRAGVDFTWLLGADAAIRYPTTALPVARTAETVVTIKGNVIAQGGVAFPLTRFTSLPRSGDAKPTFAAAAQRPADSWFALKSATK
jgi:hypothetical protein